MSASSTPGGGKEDGERGSALEIRITGQVRSGRTDGSESRKKGLYSDLSTTERTSYKAMLRKKKRSRRTKDLSGKETGRTPCRTSEEKGAKKPCSLDLEKKEKIDVGLWKKRNRPSPTETIEGGNAHRRKDRRNKPRGNEKKERSYRPRREDGIEGWEQRARNPDE